MLKIIGLTLFSVLLVFGMTHQTLATATAPVTSPYVYNFNTGGLLHEVGSLDESSSPYWWVNSGGSLTLANGRGQTIQGDLSSLSPWRTLYRANNPTDTDSGLHPQNIFRLVTRSKWQNAREEAYFIITKDNLSASSNRNSSNGLLLFNRYQDGSNLYYTGIRVDGAAVIKKKLNGSYHTLAYVPGIYPGVYNRNTNPNLMPKNKWIGLRSETETLSNGSVRIRLYLDKGWQGQWTLIAEAIDSGTQLGAPIQKAGYGGIRTDFMDVLFENFRFTTI